MSARCTPSSSPSGRTHQQRPTLMMNGNGRLRAVSSSFRSADEVEMEPCLKRTATTAANIAFPPKGARPLLSPIPPIGGSSAQPIRNGHHHHQPLPPPTLLLSSVLTSNKGNGGGGVKIANSDDEDSNRRDCAGKCVLCLLINAIFIFGVFVAFVVGHWASSKAGDGGMKVLVLNESLARSNHTSIINERGMSTSLPPPPPHSFPVSKLSIHQIYSSSPFSTYEEEVGVGGNEEDYPPESKRTNGPIIPLSRAIHPTHYELVLDASEMGTSEEHFKGNVTIHLTVAATVESEGGFIFHAASNIFINRISLWKGDQPITIVGVKRHMQSDQVRLTLNESLSMGPGYRMEIQFRTKLSHSSGVHCLRRRANHLIYGLTTKFQPSGARTVLPGFDEPWARSTFNLTIIISPSSMGGVVLSNEAAVGNGEATGITRFEQTPPMPLYLLAFSIGPWQRLEMRTARNLSLNIWVSEEDHLAVSHFAANFSAFMLDRVEEDFNVRYPLSKLDVLVMPNYPMAGLENWGLIVLNAVSALTLPTTPTADHQSNNNMTVDRVEAQYGIEKLITHEIVHQWFGDLVSISEWEELWLTEGMSTYFVLDLLNEQHPSLTEYDYYLSLAELLDRQSSIEKGHTLVRQLTSVRQLEGLFNPKKGAHFLYTKGAVMVKMVKDLVGSFDFRAGISRFLRANALQAVGRKRMWASLPAYADHGAEQAKLGEVMESWLVNEGMPEVIVSRNYEDHSVRISQRRCDQNRYVVYLEESFQWQVMGVIRGNRTERQSAQESRSVFTSRMFDDDEDGKKVGKRRRRVAHRQRNRHRNTPPNHQRGNGSERSHKPANRGRGRGGSLNGKGLLPNSRPAVFTAPHQRELSRERAREDEFVSEAMPAGKVALPSNQQGKRVGNAHLDASGGGGGRSRQLRADVANEHWWIPFTYTFGSTKSK